MNYVLYHDFAGSDKFYVRDNKNGTWNEVYNPSLATVFDSRSEAISWSKENTTFGEYAKALNITTAIKEYKGNDIRRSFNIVDHSISRKYSGESPKDILKWWISIRNKEDLGVRFEDYKTWPHLREKFEHIWDQVAYNKGKYSFSLYTRRAGNIRKFLEEFSLVIPCCTVKNEAGYKLFPIFDYHLSKDGGADFLYKNEKDCYIDTQMGIEVKGSLKGVFEFWKTTRYYE